MLPYGSYDEMIAANRTLPEDEKLDYILIVTPNFVHYDLGSIPRRLCVAASLIRGRRVQVEGRRQIDFMRNLLLGIDSGTQSTKVLVADARNGRVLAQFARAAMEGVTLGMNYGLRGILERETRRRPGPGVKLQNLIRAKTMKKGGVGYMQPGEGSFPLMADMNRFVLESGAIATLAWLDGASDGEPEAFPEGLPVAARFTRNSARSHLPQLHRCPGEPLRLERQHVWLMAMDLPEANGT
jgi:hypothetical protein